ncbi:MAG: class I SAM-dependent methyltransferase [Crocosphaera sp.]|nr:class I SAM-dependent methyltransferase [Crocosphaera sp.]
MEKRTHLSIVNYYAQRAKEYENIYTKIERQDDLQILRKLLQELLAGHNVLEIACGTGFWTQEIAKTAHLITATDINKEVIDIAKAKEYEKDNIQFQTLDAYNIPTTYGDFTAAFAGFWWSHIPLNRIEGFLKNLHQVLRPGSLVIFLDNLFVEGSNTEIIRTDNDGNTYQLRTIKNGKKYEILKNFPQEWEVKHCVEHLAERVEYTPLKYYWCLRYFVQ